MDVWCTFPDTPIISNGGLICASYQSNSRVGEIIFGWDEVNQFALTYLEVIPVNIRT